MIVVGRLTLSGTWRYATTVLKHSFLFRAESGAAKEMGKGIEVQTPVTMRWRIGSCVVGESSRPAINTPARLEDSGLERQYKTV